jgi:protoporphyrin/coproporphyrin ferrochelatase
VKEAIVLLNMGGPNNLNEVEVFLSNMFNDPNIITTKSALLRRFIATMITFFRTESSQAIYSKLGGKSPLVGHTQKLVAALERELDGVMVDFAMRYTPPFADEVCQRLKAAQIEKIYLIPLYPHYSTTTTKSSLEDFERALHGSGLDAITVEIKHFFELPSYNRSVIARIKEAMQGVKYEDFDLIFSAHGLPQKIVDAGDPYERHVSLHVRLLTQMMQDEGMHFHAIHQAYQSKVGPLKWLEPSLEQKLQQIKNRNVVIFPIAFSIDNSETDYELDMEYREIAENMGFEQYRVSRCLNDESHFVLALKELYRHMKL